jgi:hypothetical protein
VESDHQMKLSGAHVTRKFGRPRRMVLSTPTHALTMNGRISGELKGDLPPDEELRRRLCLLDGTERYSLILWAVPAETTFDRVDLRVWPREYMQAAGGPSRMTVEVRRRNGDGYSQFVVGGATGNGGRATETIEWDGVKTVVHPNEVFGVDEVAELFIEYFRTGDVPTHYRCRRLDL